MTDLPTLLFALLAGLHSLLFSMLVVPDALSQTSEGRDRFHFGWVISPIMAFGYQTNHLILR